MRSARRRHAAAVGAFLLVLAVRVWPAEDIEQTLDDLKKSAPKVYLDCERCDRDFIKDEVMFVNYVRDRKEADVHVLITQQTTGGGGREYTIAFIGQKGFADLQNVLKFYSDRTMTDDDVRKGLVQVIKLGLAPSVAKTPMAKTLNLQLLGRVTSTAVEDKWDFWVFNLSVRGRLDGEQTRKTTSISGSASVSRVTPESKFRLSAWGNFDESRFDYEDTKFTSSSKSRTLDGFYVKSITDHWSVGLIANTSSSTYSNLAFSMSVHPAVEYDLFPYSESTRRQLRFLYRLGFNYDKYFEQTIYGKLSDTLWNQSLTVTLELTEPWGSAEVGLEGSHYFHDFSLNRIVVSGDLSVRIFKGLSINVYGRYSAVHDQLNLKAGEASLEELLLRRRELASNYRYRLSIGLSYSFGSVYSNVVNPRFGGGARFEEMRY